MKGKVFLIGAGPGDVELLTLKAMRALGLADVALIDDLVNREVLHFLRPGARVIEVGKRGGCRSTPQAFIERQMVRFARQGLCVARVKGGDPFVFGRGGEELEVLRAAGIEVEVVSGITSGIGVAAALGIPVTHRNFAHGVTLVTGHTRSGDAPNWEALVRSGTTLVVYMGIGNLPQIVAGCLLEAGLPAELLHLELTETAVLGDEVHASRLLSQLRATGVKVWLDDFGTGFSGLSHLRRVPVDGVKIDRSFVADILRDPDDLALTTAIIAMAHSLGITVVAEGVEKEGQYTLLRERGCDLAQGYWLGYPVPMEEFIGLLGVPVVAPA